MTLSSIFLLFVVITAIQVPFVQNFVVHKATAYLSEMLAYPIHIGGISIKWFDKVVLEDAYLLDAHNGKMIHLSQAEIDITVLSIREQKFVIDDITLRHGQVNLIRHPGDSSLNMAAFINKINELTAPKVKTKKSKSVPFDVEQFTLDNMLFSFNDNRKPVNTDGYFDHNHFTLDSIYATVCNFRIVRDTVMLDAYDLRTDLVESHIRINDLTTSFMLTKHFIQCSNLYASVGNSIVRDYFKFEYDDIDQLSDFNEKVDITIRLKKSKLHSRDIAHFVPQLSKFKDVLNISGNFDGRVIRFDVDSIDASFGKNSHFRGKLGFDGLPNISETFMDLELKHLNLNYTDLRQYTGPISDNFLYKFGQVSGNAEFLGFTYDFVAKGNLTTDIGKVSSDINLKINENQREKSIYKGSVTTDHFEIGKLLDLPYLHHVDMTGNIAGKGFTLKDAELKVDAEISKLGIYDYEYKNISTNATLKDKFFNGELSIKDSNLAFFVSGEADFRKEKERFDIKGNVSHADLHALKFSDKESTFLSNFDLDFKGTNPDDIIGHALFENTYVSYNNNDIFVNSLLLESAKDSTQRSLEMYSDLMDANIEGNFKLSELILDVETLYSEYLLFLKENKKEIDKYYTSKKQEHRDKYSTDYNIHLKNINNVLALFFPGVYLSGNTKINGNFASGLTSILNVSTKFDTLIYKGNEIYNTSIDLETSKVTDSSNVLASLSIKSDSQKINSVAPTKDFIFTGEWNHNLISFSSAVHQANNKNNINISGNLLMLEEKKLLTLDNRSSLNLLDKIWSVSDSNEIYFNSEEITFNNFKVSNADQYIALSGSLSNDPDKEGYVTIKNFNVESINSLIAYKLKGMLNGSLKMRDVYKNPDVTGFAFVKDFMVDNFLIGDIGLKSEWNNSDQQLDISINVMREMKEMIKAFGNIKTKDQKEEIDIAASFNEADFGLLNPILKGIVSNISGKVTGGLKISGELKHMKVIGEADVADGKFKVDYLGTTYHFDDKIYLDENLIGFKNLRLKDINGNIARLSGGVYHDGFKNFIMDLKGKMKNVNILHTTEKDNDLFYGTAFATGDLNIFGPFNDLGINVNAKSEKDTKIYIPITSKNDVSQHEYITFKNQVTVKEKEKKKTTEKPAGIKLELNLELTPDAYTEIIFDKKTGDIIRGRGQGNIKMEIDTRGDFNMYGSYTIKEGWYNFTMAGLINKEFLIDQGSSIQWGGNPYEGQLNIKGKYRQFSSLKPLIVDTILAKSADLLKTYPANVLLGITGNLLTPSITFDIEVLKYPTDPSISAIILDYIGRLKYNEQELNKQVFSLIMLGRFSPPNSFSGVQSAGISNVSDLLSSQLSNFLSQVDNNLEVNVNLKSLDKDALNTFQVRMAYTLFAGRLKITRDGNFQNAQASQNANISNIAGEWTVEYMLSQDGRFRLKIFNKINNNTLLTSLNSNSNTSAGFSVMHTQGFNNLGDIFKRKKPKTKHTIIPHENPMVPDSTEIINDPTQ